MQKCALWDFSPEKDLRLYSFPPPFKDEETGTQGTQTDIPFKNVSNCILSIARYFYFLTCLKLDELKS